jgi:hypothetical protein
MYRIRIILTIKKHIKIGKGSLDNGYLDNKFLNKYEKNLKNRKNFMDMFFYL